MGGNFFTSSIRFSLSIIASISFFDSNSLNKFCIFLSLINFYLNFVISLIIFSGIIFSQTSNITVLTLKIS